jgi:hypothetical protein
MNNKRALPLDYQKYLKRKVGQPKKSMEEGIGENIKNPGCLSMPCSEIVQ